MDNSILKNLTMMAEIQDTLDKSESRINGEFSRSANTWLDCFGTRVFILETYLNLRVTKSELGPRYLEITNRLETLKERLAALKEIYPAREPAPPGEVQAELLKSLMEIVK